MSIADRIAANQSQRTRTNPNRRVASALLNTNPNPDRRHHVHGRSHRS